MKNEKHDPATEDRSDFGPLKGRSLEIGISLPRADAYGKVTGRERYAADYYGSDLVWAAVKRAGVPHARLKSIATETATALPGVLGVLTYADVSGSNRQGVVRKDQPVLVNDKVRHAGDAVALVLAETRETARKAMDLITVDLEVLTPVLDQEDALLDGAPLVNEDHADGNTLLKGEFRQGDPLAAAEACDVVVEAVFETPRVEHAYLETEVGWAQVSDSGNLVIVVSTQTPFRDRMEVAEALGLEANNIRIIAPYAGGAFGGKDGVTVQSLLGLAAMHARGRPVKMWWDREESIIAGTKRHASKMHYRVGAKSDGTLHFLDAGLSFDTGPYDHLGGVVMTLALEHGGSCYRIPNVGLRGRAVYTNNPIGGAFRGFGVAQVTGAMEQMMDLLASRLDMDPLALRLKNAVRRGDKNAAGVTLVHSTGLVECLERVSRHPMWTGRSLWKQSAGPFTRRGVGIAALMHGSGYGPLVPDVANAKVELTPEGTIRIYSGVVDMGQGNAATNLQIAGSILGQRAEQMELVQPDTDRTLPSGSASASRCTYTFGNALIPAAKSLKLRMLQRAADLVMARGPEEMALIPGRVRNMATGTDIPLARLAQFMDASERIATHRFRAPTAKDPVAVDEQIRLHGFPHTLYSYAAHVACVEVDELTGRVDVTRYLAVSDCGKIINPQIYEQQVQGGIAQGIGYALSEEIVVDQGIIKTPDLSTFIIPTAVDVPPMESHAVEIHEDTGPYGLKGVGEIATNGPLPAIANAVADACGVRVFTNPLTPERVLEALSRAHSHDGGSA